MTALEAWIAGLDVTGRVVLALLVLAASVFGHWVSIQLALSSWGKRRARGRP